MDVLVPFFVWYGIISLTSVTIQDSVLVPFFVWYGIMQTNFNARLRWF